MDEIMAKLLELARRRDALLYLYMLFSSPEYRAPWWYWEDYFKANKN